MKKFKRALSVFLVFALLITTAMTGSATAPVQTPEAPRTQSLSEKSAAPITFLVPELIYLTPSEGTTSTFQYYVDSTSGGVLSTAKTKTDGAVYFHCADATAVSIATSGATVTMGTSTGTTTVDTTVTAGILSTALTNGSVATVTWTATYTVNGKPHTAKAYSVAYAPQVRPVGVVLRMYNSDGDRFDTQGLSYISGVHDAGIGDTNFNLSGEYRVAPLLGAVTNPNGGNIHVPSYTSGTNGWVRLHEWAGGDNHRNEVRVSPTATMTVDTSRYTNINQIPNLTCGMLLSNLTGTNSVRWYMTNYSGENPPVTGWLSPLAETGTNNSADRDAWFHGDQSGFGTDPRRQFIGSGGTESSGDGTNMDPIASQITYGAQTGGAMWNQSIEGVGTDNIRLKAAMFGRFSNWLGTETNIGIMFTNVTVAKVNNTTLRNAVHTYTNYGLQAADYTPASWTVYENALKVAAENLGNPTTAPISTGALTTAYNNLVPAISYQITFDANGGEGGEVQTVSHGTVPIPPTVTRAGYNFAGWNPTIVTATADATYTAQWTLIPPTYQITFDANGGVGGTVQTVNEGAIPVPPTVTRVGYTFVAWTPAIVAATEDATYTAEWEEAVPVTYQITFDANGGQGGTVQTVNEGTVPVPPTVTRSGYIFTGWTPAIAAATADTTYTAQWEESVGLTVTIDLEVGRYVGGTADANWVPLAPGETLAADDIITVRIAPESDFLCGVTRYITMFDKQHFQIVGSGKSAFTPNYNNAFYAAVAPDWAGATSIPKSFWPASMQEVEFDDYTAVAVNNAANSNSANGGYPDYLPGDWLFRFDLKVINAVNAETDARIWMDTRWVRNPDAPTLPMYFTKLESPDQLSASGSSSDYFFNVNLTNADISLPFPMVSYQITFDADGGEGGEVQTVDHGTVPVPPTVTKEGFVFAGWTPALVAATEDAIYTAQWADPPTTYQIIFDADGGEGGEIQTVEEGTVPVPPTVTREGYTFTGWVPDIVAATEDAVYTAQWDMLPTTFQITFDAAGGEGSEVQTVEVGTVPVPPTVTKEGYTFAGWTPAIVEATEDATYTALWTINTYEITFDADGGQGGEVQTVEYGKLPVAPEVTREGYTFAGWVPEIVEATEDTTYTALWLIHSYQITFDAGGGQGGEVQTVYYGVLPVAPAVTREGYTFAGWTPAIVEATEDATYIALWTINTYEITFDADGGQGGEMRTVEYGTLPVAPEVTREGYTFAGWAPAIVEANEDATYTAQWTINTYDAVFMVDGEVYATVPTVFGESIAVPADPEKEGYLFEGWDPTPDTIGAGDETFDALWSKIPATLTAKDGSAAIVDDDNGFIYGLPEGMTAKTFVRDYIEIGGDGVLRITFYTDSFGTGTKVELLDGETGEVIKTYYIVIFGDTDGDGYITGSDENLMAMAGAQQGGFETGSPFAFAADLTGDGSIDNDDLLIIRAVNNYLGTIDQTNPSQSF